MKSIVLSTLAAVLVLAVALTLSTEQRENKFYAKAKAEKSKREVAGAKGSSDFFFEMRKNPITGKVSLKDMKNVAIEIQQKSTSTFKTTALPNLEWEERGPDDIGGRTRALLVDKDDPNKIYMGMVSGGFWTSNDRGNTWTQMAGYDSTIRLSVTTIAQASNGDVYFGTGESFANISGTGFSRGIPGNGIYKSTDRGVSAVNLTATRPAFDDDNGTWSYVNRIVTDPNDANHIFAGINRGLYESTDGGASWSKAFNPSSPILDVDISANGNVILASGSTQMHVSEDGGATFDLNINNTSRGLPGLVSGINRIEVSIAPSDENRMYCVISAGGQTEGVYESKNKGQNWITLRKGGSQAWNPLGSQGGYNIALGVHPTNADMIFVGGQLDLYRFTPNPNTWDAIAFWRKTTNSVASGTYVHADMHGVMFNPSNPDEMYMITDGGFFRTADCTIPQPYFIEKNKNYSTAQCYGVAANYLGQIIFGTQDNGTNIINGQLANSPNNSIDAMGGDGMRGAASDIDPDYFFGTLQYGVLQNTSDGGSPSSFRSTFDKNIDNLPENNVDGRPDEGSNWIAPTELFEKSTGTETKSVLFIGLTNTLWFSQNAVDNSPTVWFPMYRLGNPNGNRSDGFTTVAASEDGKVVYAGSGTGRLVRITGIDLFDTKYEYNDTTTNLFLNGFDMDSSFVVTPISGPWSGHITDVQCNEDGSELLITVPGYGVANHVYRSLNALDSVPTITSIQGNGSGRLPAMPVYSIAMLSQANSYLVGTDLGLWGTDNGGASWTELNNIGGAVDKWHPRAAVLEVVVKPTLRRNGQTYNGDVIYTGTYGRGTFMSTTLASLINWPTSTTEVTKKVNNLNVYPNPVNNQAHIKYEGSQAGEGIVSVISLTGRVIKSSVVQLNAGENEIDLDVSYLSKGVYMISVSSKNGLVTTKIVKR